MSPAQEANYELQSVTRTASNNELGKIGFAPPKAGGASQPTSVGDPAVGSVEALNLLN